ncbi:putative methyltransferase [Rosa chinensis]|uniref:Protein arginine N-methyltransferase n=1 Tax=Rosa chinensis TaxID=74649 RepID=A0A2P6P8C8_ROSCH|nr:protein arginine N-methyltransferase 1.6 [Rosa chinensis]PRQ18184.1 putative methyltransferase [Rosa chinensis]
MFHRNLLPLLSKQVTLQLKPRLTRAMSSQFQLRVNPLTGNSEWIVIDENEPEGPTSNTSQNALLATTSYLDMLNDSPRNRAYRQAIDKTVTKPCRVLDIGAGTGLLSMMAARAMGSTTCRMVTACESYLPMVKLMKKVLRLNDMEKQIKLINKRSDELELGVDINSRAQVLVSEILDSELLGEGLIPSLQHAHDMLLVESPETVPYRATTYGQLVESTFLWKLHDLRGNEAEACDGIRLVPTGFENVLGVKQQQYALHCNAIANEVKLLSEPFKIFEFDFSKRPESRGETELSIKATNDGRVHAVISWWILQLDREGTIFYSTAPRWINLPVNMSHGDWCDHWKQCVWFVPGGGMSVNKDEEVCLHAVHTDISISYNIKSPISRNKSMQYDLTSRDLKLILPPERIAIYGDSEWRHTMFNAISNALQGRVDPLCIVADDSVFLTLLVAHLSKTSHVMSFFPGLQDKGLQYLQAVASANNFSVDRVEYIKKKKTMLTLHDTHQKKVDLLIAEPFYYGTDNMLPWQNLRFWNERTMLDSVLSEDALIMPCKAILKACALSIPDLWNSRRSLSKIEGFDHSVVNSTLGACGELPGEQEGPCLPYFIWQCGNVKKLSEAFTVMEFDFSKLIMPSHGKTQIEFTVSGICHGFAVWIDWVMDSEHSIVLSTGPDKRYWKQGVKLLAKPVGVGKSCSSAVIEASFDPSSGDLDVRHAFS